MVIVHEEVHPNNLEQSSWGENAQFKRDLEKKGSLEP